MHFFWMSAPISLNGQGCHKYLLEVYDSGDITSLADSSCLKELTGNMGNAYFLFKSAIQSSNPTYTRYLLLQFPAFGFTLDEITDMLDDTSRAFIETLMMSDSTIKESYNEKLISHMKYFDTSTQVELINEMYAVDQFARVDYRNYLTKESFSDLLTIVDSINFIILFEKFQASPEFFVDKQIGHKTLKQLYIILLHSCRYISDDKFNLLNAILLNLVHEKKFSPYYYANIYDERLRVQESPSYPYYNLLRNEILGPDQAKAIEMNRRGIGAIQLASKDN
jgi:hypothetical protein